MQMGIRKNIIAYTDARMKDLYEDAEGWNV